MPKQHEFRFDVCVFARAKTEAAAKKAAERIDALLKSELSDFMKYRVSYTGSSVQIEDLDEHKGKIVVKSVMCK